MNIKTKLTAAAVGALGLVWSGNASAQAPVTIYLAGANGDRTTVNTALANLLGGGSYKGGVNATATSSNYVIFEGNFNGTPVRVKGSFIGAAGGIYGVAGQQTIKFLPDSAVGAFNNPDPTVGSNPNEAIIPDVAVSSSSQANSPYVGEFDGITYDTNLVDQVVAIMPMTWVGSPGFPGSNITTQQARLLYTTGAAPLSVFTGNAADRNKIVYAFGRNLDAGQRITAQQEIGIGWATFVKQYKPVITGAVSGFGGEVTSHQLWPVDPNNYSGGSSLVPGNGGQDTGGNLIRAVSSTLSPAAYQLLDPTATAGWYVSYITPGDAKAAINGGNVQNGKRVVPLAYNGVTIWNGDLSNLADPAANFDYTAIQEGQYTFWTYERIYYKTSLAGLKKDFADALANEIKTNVAGPGTQSVNLSTVVVERVAEGELVSPSYF